MLGDEEAPEGGLDEAVASIDGAYSCVAEVAPAVRPGRGEGMGYGELLALLRERGLGERDAVGPGETAPSRQDCIIIRH